MRKVVWTTYYYWYRGLLLVRENLAERRVCKFCGKNNEFGSTTAGMVMLICFVVTRDEILLGKGRLVAIINIRQCPRIDPSVFGIMPPDTIWSQ